MSNKVLSLLGLAQRAGKIVSGDESVLAAVRAGEARLVLLATDAAANARKKYTDKCRSYGVRLVEFGTRDQLGHALGKRERVVVAVNDDGFARLALASLEKSSNEVKGIDKK